MRYQTVDRVVEGLRKNGFDMGTKDFFDTTIYKILKRYRIYEQLDLDEYFELLRRLMDFCAENDMKNMNVTYLNENDFQFK